MEKEAGEAIALGIITVALIAALSCFIGRLMDINVHTRYRESFARCESMKGYLSTSDKCFVNGEEK